MSGCVSNSHCATPTWCRFTGLCYAGEVKRPLPEPTFLEKRAALESLWVSISGDVARYNLRAQALGLPTLKLDHNE